MKKPKTQAAATSALNWLEEAIGHPKRVDMIDSMVIAKMVSEWRRFGTARQGAQGRDALGQIGWRVHPHSPIH